MSGWSVALSPIRSGWKCPRCKSPMVLRMRATDAHAFYGCTGFPVCRGTRNLDGTANGHPDPHGNMDSALEESGMDNNGWGAD